MHKFPISKISIHLIKFKYPIFKIIFISFSIQKIFKLTIKKTIDFQKYNTGQNLLRVNYFIKYSTNIQTEGKRYFIHRYQILDKKFKEMSQEMQLIEIAKYLAELIQTDITSSPAEPELIIKALRLLIPEAEQFLDHLESLAQEQQQWNEIIHFIQTQIFDEGTEFGFQKLDTEEIIEIYKVIIQMVEQAMGDQQQDGQNQFQQQRQQEEMQRVQKIHKSQSDSNKKQINQNRQPQRQVQHHQSSGNTEEGSQGQQHQVLQSNERNLQKNQPKDNDYIQMMKKQKQKQKQMKQKDKRKQQNTNQKKLEKKQKKQPKQQKSDKKKKQKQEQENKKHHAIGQLKQSQTFKQFKQEGSGKKPKNKEQKIKKSSSVIQKNKQQKLRPQSSVLSKKQQAKNYKKQRKTQKNGSSTINYFRQNDNEKQVKKGKSRPKTAKNSMKHSGSQIGTKQNFHHKSKIQQSHRMDLQQNVISTINQAMKKRKISSQDEEKRLKSNPLMKNNQGLELMQKAKRRFDYQIKNHKQFLKVKKQQKVAAQKKQLKLNSKIKSNIDQKGKSTLSKDNYSKYLKHKQKQMQQQVLNQQLKYYLKLRDKKINYIKHMHKLMEKLQKQRQIDLNKKQNDLKKQEKQKINKKLKHADKLFQDNIKQIKQNYKNQKMQNLLKNDQEIKIMKQLEKNMNQNKQNQINMMKTLWEQERMKLDLISKDEENMKSKLEEIYRKNKV